jgi:hypothetical protein
MFRVEADSLDAYLNFDPERKKHLLGLDKVIRSSAPNLKRFFHAGTPAGEPGMRFKMIGYGQFHYPTKSGARVAWPVIGVALQKNYISVYFAIAIDDKPVVDPYVGKLGELRSGINNFSFQSFDELEPKALAALFADAASIFETDPDNPARTIQRG